MNKKEENIAAYRLKNKYLRTHLQWIAAIVDLLQLKWISPNLRYPTSKMAEIWTPSIFFQYICTCKVSASYRLNSQTCISESSEIE